jgi:hypothetical protein
MSENKLKEKTDLQTMDDAVPKSEEDKRAEEELFVSRILMASGLQATKLAQSYARSYLNLIEEKAYDLPETIEPKDIQSLVTSLKNASLILESSVSILQKQQDRIKESGKSAEKTTGSQIGKLLDLCTPDELSEILSTGELPSRLIDHHAMRRQSDTKIDIRAAKEAESEIEATFKAEFLKQQEDDNE